MKKILLAFAAIAAGFFSANAQYDYSNANRLDSIETAMANANARMAELRADSIRTSIWRGKSYFNVGYSVSSTSNGNYAAEKGSYGFFINLGNQFLWPKKAVADIVKFGLDVRWLDIDFTGFPKFNRYLDNPQTGYIPSTSTNTDQWIGDMSPSTPSESQEARYLEFTHLQLLAGLVGIGPTITVAPFAKMETALSSLRLNLYFHYQPTAVVSFYKAKYSNDSVINGDDSAIEAGYVSMFDFGGKIQWKNIGIGIEGRWGSGKLKDTNLHIGDGPKYDYTKISLNGCKEPGMKYTRKFGETRIFFALSF